MAEPLWTLPAMAQAMRAISRGNVAAAVPGLSIDTRTIGRGEAFFAIRGDNRDGHDFVAAALKAGGGIAVVEHARAGDFSSETPLLLVDDVLAALRDLGVAARARTQAKVIGVTGSVGKTGTKEALRLALSREGATHASAASYNNHWGVPLSLARMPQATRFAVLEMGMNHAGEIAALTKMVRPHVAIVTTVEPVHLEFFGTLEAIADAKAEIFEAVELGGAAVLNRDNAQFARLAAAARAAGVTTIVGFGEHGEAQVRLTKLILRPDCSVVEADILGVPVTYKLGAPGRHLVQNSLAVLAATKLAGADLALAALALGDLAAPTGRGAQRVLAMPGGEAVLIDESYNANPASMRAGLALLGQSAIGPRGRRIAVLGDMLELGPQGEALHRGLADAVEANGIDLVFCSGPLMRALYDALPASRRGGYATASADLATELLQTVQAGDAIMIKGSLGSKMAPLVKSLADRYTALAVAATA